MTTSHNDRPRQLRRDMTDAERRLWSALRDRRLRGYRFPASTRSALSSPISPAPGTA